MQWNYTHDVADLSQATVAGGLCTEMPFVDSSELAFYFKTFYSLDGILIVDHFQS